MHGGIEALDATDLLAALPDPALVIAVDGVIRYANPAAGRLFGLPPEQVAGTGILRFLPEAERARLEPLAWLRRWAERPDAPELGHVFLHCRSAAGRDIPVRVRVGKLATDPPGYLIVLQDIAATQARLNESRRAHRLAARVLAISADAILIVDAALVIRYANASAERLFGYASGSLTGRMLADLLPARFRTTHAARMQAFAAAPEAARLMGDRGEVLGLSATGEELPLEASITKVTLGQDVVFSAHLRDLRPRKAAEAALARSQAGLEAVFEHALQPMAIIRPDGRVQAMNRAGRELLPAGLDPVARAFADLPFWSQDPGGTARTLGEAVARCRAGDTFQTPAIVVMPDGTERHLDVALWPVRNGDEIFAIVAEARAPSRTAA